MSWKNVWLKTIKNLGYFAPKNILKKKSRRNGKTGGKKKGRERGKRGRKKLIN